MDNYQAIHAISDLLGDLSDELVKHRYIVVPTWCASEIASLLTKRMCVPVMGGALSMDMLKRCLYID